MPTKTKQSETKKIPRLRFPGFSGEWEKKELGRICKITTGKLDANAMVTNGKYHFYTCAKDFYQINDFAFDAEALLISGNGANVGYVHYYKGKFNAYQRTYVLDEFSQNIFFIKIYLDKFLGDRINKEKKEGNTPYIVLSTLTKMKIQVPSIEEQQKIAGFLGSVDKWIENLREQKENLESYKKGMMQKIFSQEIRFKDDKENNFPEWEEKKLKEYLFLSSRRNKEKKLDLVLSVNNKKGFVIQTEQFEDHRVASKDVSNYKIVEKGDFAYNPSRINVGSIALLKKYERGIVSPMYVVFKLSKKLHTSFFENYIKTHYFKYLVKISCTGSVRESLNFKDLIVFKIKLPSYPEQQKIVEFLTAIDNLIKLKQQQVTQVESWKKGLMQMLFI